MMPAIILFAVWKNFVINMIIFVAALQGDPPRPYEAARIEGAIAGAAVLAVTRCPLLGPTLLIGGVGRMAGTFHLSPSRT